MTSVVHVRHKAQPRLQDLKIDLRPRLRIALVQPRFPWPSKSKNSHQSIPYGLMKIGAWLKSFGIEVRLFPNGELPSPDEFVPDEVWVTTLFTFWSDYVRVAVQAYRQAFPTARFRVGGILTTLASVETYSETMLCMSGWCPPQTTILPTTPS